VSHSSYKVTVKGLNLHHVIDFFERENIYLTDIERTSPQKLTFIINDKNYKLFKKSSLFKAYKVRIIKRYGLENYFRVFLSKLGLFSGIIICVLTCFNLTNRIHEIHLIADNHTCQNEQHCIYNQENQALVVSALNQLGVYENSPIKNLPSAKTIRKHLMLKFSQIADVTAYRKGVHFYVEILEAKLPIKETSHNIIAPENGIIISTECSSGVLKVKNGDIVLKGQTLVEAQDNITPNAKITLRSFYHDTYIFNESQISYVRTGKKIYANDISLFGLKLQSSVENKFTFYETESSSNYAFLNLFLPITVNKYIYYELEAVNFDQTFESQKERIYKELEDKIKEKIPINADIKNTTYSVIEEGSRHRIDCYIETYLTIEK